MKHLFPVFKHHPDLVYLDNAATTHKPQAMIDALSTFYAKDYATVHRAIYRASLYASEQYAAARETVRAFLNAEHVEEIVFTRGTTDALNIVAQAQKLVPGDEILITEMEHHSNIVPWQMLAQRTGATLCVASVDDRGVLLWEGKITPKTKIVAVAHMSNVTGTINPIREIASAAHLIGAIIVVDGAQAAPHLPVDVVALDVDFYAFSGHKCYGPTGIGVLYGKKDLLNALPPVDGGGDMIVRVDFASSTYQAAPLRFEAGTPIIGSVIALKSSLDLIETLGKEAISSHETELLRFTTKQIQTIEGVKIIGTSPEKGPILTFSVKDIHSLDLATFLDLDGIAVRSGHLCAQPILRRFGCETALRVSFGLYNTLDDARRFIASLNRIITELRGVGLNSMPVL